MRNFNYVCIRHREVSRGYGPRYCPVDGAEMVSVGDRFPIPKRLDDRGWHTLAGVADLFEERRSYQTHRLERPWWERAKALRLLARWS